MKKIVTFASNAHVRALLSCSAAVLLTACGGTNSDSPAVTAASGVQSALASDATVAAEVQAPALTDESTGTGAFAQASVSSPDVAAPQPARLLAAMTSSSLSASDQITDLYHTLLKREPDAAGLQYWTQALNSGIPLDSIRAQFMASTEYQNLQAGTVPADTSIYHLYVSTAGSDSNTGTAAMPYKTISKAASVAKPGTTVHVAAGTYYGNVATKLSGTSTNRIRFVSDTKWGAKIIGSGSEAMWTNNGNYVDIVGFDISGPGRLGILNYASYALVSNNHIHHLTLSGGCTGSGGAGVVNATYTSTGGDIIGNVVHDISKPGACNGVQGIYISNKGAKVMNNIVYRVSSYGIHLWHGAGSVTVANNTVFANGSSGMGGGIVSGNGDSGGGVLTYTKVINNIVVNNPRSGISQYCYSGATCIGTGNVTSNNLVYGNGANIQLRTGSATGTITADPKFVSYNPAGTGDYRLQSISPAINKGTSSSAPTTDILGVARPKGGAFDIGAYESY
jgi:hypothetical protein